MHLQNLDKRLNKAKLQKTLTKYTNDPVKLETMVNHFIGIDRALRKGNSVWVECEKMPRSLDAGRHWYQIYYNEVRAGKAIKVHFWTPPFMDKNRDTSCYGYGFSSRAIGMSRVLDATDWIFRILKEHGGVYTQLSF